MSQNNSNNDSEQESLHQPNFIPPVKREGKEERVHLHSRDLRKLKRKGGRKNVLSEKGKESHLPHHQMFPAVTPQQTPNQRLHLLSKDSR